MSLSRALAPVFAAIVFSASVSAQSGDDAAAFVRTTVDTVLERANAAPKPLEAGSAAAVDIAATQIGPHLDLEAASKRILGTAWRDADDGQKQRFAKAFQDLAVNLFASALPGFPGAVVEVVPQEKKEARRLELVRTVARPAKGAATRIDFRVHQVDGRWRVVDFTVEGISMLTTYKAEFASILARSGLEGLIVELEKRAARPPG